MKRVSRSLLPLTCFIVTFYRGACARELPMIDSLDWRTCRARYCVRYRECCRLTIDRRTKCMRETWGVLAAAPIQEPVKLYDEGFRCLMNEHAVSLFLAAFLRGTVQVTLTIRGQPLSENLSNNRVAKADDTSSTLNRVDTNGSVL